MSRASSRDIKPPRESSRDIKPSRESSIKPSEDGTPNEPGNFKRRLPLYGSLSIERLTVFLQDSKTEFIKRYNSKFPFVLKITNFKILRLLGKGAFGDVYLVKYARFNSSYAMKALDKENMVEQGQVQHCLNEKKILQSVDSPFCVRLEYFSKDNSFIYFLLPFVSGGELFARLRKVKRFQEDVARFYAAQVVLGFEYLHYQSLVYRDLKPENLLMDHLGYIKITDFGFTKIVQKKTYTFCGTPDYISPEMIVGHGHNQTTDWWSFGVLLYELAAGQPPFFNEENDNMKTFDHIVKCKYSMPKHFSRDLSEIIKRFLQVDVTRRLGNSISGVEAIKSQSWFRQTDWNRTLNRMLPAPYVPPRPDMTPGKMAAPRVSQNDKHESIFGDF